MALKRFAAITVAAVSFAVLAACATATMSPSASDIEAKKFVAPPGKGRVYVVRPGTQGALGMLQVVIDGKVVGSLPIETYLVVDVDPGQHTVTIGGPTGQVVFPLTVADGELKFIRQRAFGVVREDTVEDGKKAVLGSNRILESRYN